jgi:hypothetical protein
MLQHRNFKTNCNAGLSAFSWISSTGRIKLENINPNPSNFTFRREWTWDAIGSAGVDTLIAIYGSAKKQIPLTIKETISQINSYNETSEVSEVTSQTLYIVTNNTTIDIATVKEGNLNVAIYDLTGSKVMNVIDEYVNENTTMKIDLNNLSNLAVGSYVVVVTSGNDVATRKFIKQ